MPFTKRFLVPVVAVAALLFAGAACGSDSGSASGFCDTIQQWADGQEVFSDDAAPGTEDFDESMAAAKEITDDLRRNAPAEIADDVATLGDMIDVMADLDFEDPQAMMDVAGKFDQNELDQATQNIEEYAKSECDVDLSTES